MIDPQQSDKRALIVGGESLIGSALANLWTMDGRSFLVTTRRPNNSNRIFFDLESSNAELLPKRLRTAIVCAAVTSQEQCRKNPITTRSINVMQTVKLIEFLISTGCFVVFLSTNLVFDGSIPKVKTDEPWSPATEYGRQKTEAEQKLFQFLDQMAIVRLTKVLHPDLAIVHKWRNDLSQHKEIFPFADYVFSPVSLSAVTHCISDIAGQRLPGIWHLSGLNDISYSEFAQLIAGETSGHLVKPMKSPASGIEHVPRHTTLDISKTAQRLNISFPTAQSTIFTIFNTQYAGE